MKNKQDPINEIKEYLEDLVSMASQTADSASVNLTTKFEDFQEKIEQRFSTIELDLVSKEQTRWSWFRWIITAVVTTIAGVIIIAGDKLHSQLEDLRHRTIVIEQNDKNQITAEKLNDLINTDKNLSEKIQECIRTNDLLNFKKEVLELIIKHHSKNGGN